MKINIKFYLKSVTVSSESLSQVHEGFPVQETGREMACLKNKMGVVVRTNSKNGDDPQNIEIWNSGALVSVFCLKVKPVDWST